MAGLRFVDHTLFFGLLSNVLISGPASRYMLQAMILGMSCIPPQYVVSIPCLRVHDSLSYSSDVIQEVGGSLFQCS